MPSSFSREVIVEQSKLNSCQSNKEEQLKKLLDLC